MFWDDHIHVELFYVNHIMYVGWHPTPYNINYDLQVRGHVELLIFYVHVNHIVHVGWHLQIHVCFVHVVFAMLNLFPYALLCYCSS